MLSGSTLARSRHRKKWTRAQRHPILAAVARLRIPKPVVGWREWVALPDLHIGAIKVKVDTGARTSALHAFDVETYRRGGREYVKFEVHPAQRTDRGAVTASARVVDRRDIKSSTGHLQTRYVIETTLALGEHRYPIELTLTNRDEMGFRMLLGRAAVRGHFLVDPARSFLVGKKPGRTG